MLLATERASRTIPRATLSNVHRPRKVWLAIAAFCGTLMALIILIGSVERLRASNSIALASSVSPTDTATFDQLVARVKALRDLSSTNLNEIAVAHQRQRLVEEISVRCWTAMWGPTEDYVKTSLVSVAPDIRQTLDWDFAHDPQSAVRILGNCHRILCKVTGFVDWKSLLDKAASVVIDWNAQETGRLFCGIAFAHWNDDAARGFAYAQKAERIFERIPNADWD